MSASDNSTFVNENGEVVDYVELKSNRDLKTGDILEHTRLGTLVFLQYVTHGNDIFVLAQDEGESPKAARLNHSYTGPFHLFELWSLNKFLYFTGKAKKGVEVLPDEVVEKVFQNGFEAAINVANGTKSASASAPSPVTHADKKKAAVSAVTQENGEGGDASKDGEISPVTKA